MTSPKLSIITTEEIGRLYQLPNGTYGPNLSSFSARKGLQMGTLFPSITNVISAINPDMEGYVSFMIGKGLDDGQPKREALKNHITFRDAASARGTRVHKAIEDFIEGGYSEQEIIEFQEGMFSCEDTSFMEIPSFKAMVSNDSEYGDLNHWRAFLRFIIKYKPKFIYQEATVYGRTLNGEAYAGTTDFIAEIDGKLVVGDWKTSSKMSGTVALQLSAAMFAKKMTVDMETLIEVPAIEEAWGIHLDKNGSYGVYKAVSPVEAFSMFSAARTLWNFYIAKKSVLDKVAE